MTICYHSNAQRYSVIVYKYWLLIRILHWDNNFPPFGVMKNCPQGEIQCWPSIWWGQNRSLPRMTIIFRHFWNKWAVSIWLSCPYSRAGYYIASVFSLFFLLSSYPARIVGQGIILLQFLLSSSFSCLACRSSRAGFWAFVSFSFPLLATRLFHILPYTQFWPNLVKVTNTLTTTHTQKLMGSGVTMGSLGSKR